MGDEQGRDSGAKATRSFQFLDPVLSGFYVYSMYTGGAVASGSHSGGTYIERITDDAREDEMEENMQAV